MKSMFVATLLSLFAVPFAWGADAQSCQTQTAYTITAQAKGADLKAVAAKLEADPAFKSAKCAAIKGKASGLSYSCANPSEKSDAAFRTALGAGMTLASTTVGCPVGCSMTYCPYPTMQCCNNVTHMPCQ